MAAQQNNILLLPDDGITRIIDTASDTIEISVDTSFTSGANVVVNGNLTVEGTTFTTESETVLIADNHLYLNDGYTTVSAETGGLVVNYLPTATSDTVAATGFTAGVAATSNPTVNTTGAATFSAGEFVQISDANNVENDGLYEVLTHAANLLTIRGIGTTATQEDFTQNQFTTDTTVAGTITKVNVSILRSGTDGAWEVGLGSSSPTGTPLTFTDISVGVGSATLQSAYDNGNTITTAAATDIAFTLTSGDFTVDDGNIDFGGTTALTTFNLDTSGAITVDSSAGGISLDGAASSNLTTSAGDLTLSNSSTTAGDIVVISSAGNAADANSIDIDATNGGITMDAGTGISIDAGAASNFSTSAGDLTLAATTNSVIVQGAEAAADAVYINASDAAGGIDMDAGTAGIAADTTGPLSLDSTGTAANFTLTATDGGASTMVIASTNAGAGTGNLDISVDDAITVDSDTFSIDSTGTSNISVTGAAGEDFTVAQAGAADASLILSSTGTGTDALQITATSGGIVLTGEDNDAAFFDINAGGLDYITFDSTDGSECIHIHQDICLDAGVGFTIEFTTGTGGVTANYLVTMEADTADTVILADGNAATETERFPIGVAKTTEAAASAVEVYTIAGQVIPIQFTAAPAAADIGDRVYLSTTSGLATTTPPTGTGVNVFVVGILKDADGATNPAEVIWMPQFIARRP